MFLIRGRGITSDEATHTGYDEVERAAVRPAVRQRIVLANEMKPTAMENHPDSVHSCVAFRMLEQLQNASCLAL